MTEPLSFDAATRALLQRYGFDEDAFSRARSRLDGTNRVFEANVVRGAIAPPHRDDGMHLPALGSAERRALSERGRRAIAEGAVGAIVLAGGMATRFGGVVKAAVPVLDGESFLALKAQDVAAAARTSGGRVPLFPMTSFATHEAVAALAAALSTDRCPIEPFPQGISLRLDRDGALFRDAQGAPSPYAPGHGDLPWALQRSGILGRFRRGGGRVLYMSNVDNLTATLDPAVIGAHLERGAEVTVEVAPKHPGDKGGAPARVDGVPQIVEGFRFPADFDQARIAVFNTNSFVFDAAALARDYELTWLAVEKEVDGRRAVQFEHLVGELTRFVSCAFLEVEREGDDARFQPIKTPDDLVSEVPLIAHALRARGVL
ncbi:MAG: UTP--glucose-1-phosphate uridylyltransferase [Myxococcales bacterium]|nr:UTP--glucose-1-phosphate uridylyltransferase [Myxococcales bacterium]